MQDAARQKAAYSNYVTAMAQVNTDREAAGLTNVTVLCYADWRAQIWYHGDLTTNSPASSGHHP